MGGYERIVTDLKGRQWLKRSDIQMLIPLPKKITRKGEKIIDEIVGAAAKALVRRMEK